jgi:hypothetical protein
MPTDEYQIVIHADKRPAGEHERRYNSPNVDEVAVIVVGQESDKRDTERWSEGTMLARGVRKSALAVAPEKCLASCCRGNFFVFVPKQR